MKKLLVLLWVLVIPISYLVGNTYAWFNDTVTATAVISSGDIDIEQSEVFDQNQVIAPVIPGTGDVSTWKNYVKKTVTVENKGSLPAYVRTFVAVPTGRGNALDSTEGANWIHLDINTDWHWDTDVIKNVDINGTVADPADSSKTISYSGTYDIYVATCTSPLAFGSSVSPMEGFWIDSTVSNDDHGGYYYVNGGRKVECGKTDDVKILVATQATQYNIFNDEYGEESKRLTAIDALNKVFGTPAIANNPWKNTGTVSPNP